MEREVLVRAPLFLVYGAGRRAFIASESLFVGNFSIFADVIVAFYAFYVTLH